MTAFNVYRGSKLIDTVFYSSGTNVDAAEVKQSLINHDGYDPNIRVVKARKSKSKKDLAPVHLAPIDYSPVPDYNAKEDGDYSAWLVSNNID